MAHGGQHTLGGNEVDQVPLQDPRKALLLKFPLLTVDMASVEPLAGKVHLAKVALEAPELNVRRDAGGNINLMALVPEQKKEEEKKAGERKDEGDP